VHARRRRCGWPLRHPRRRGHAVRRGAQHDARAAERLRRRAVRSEPLL
jgi:hypothetical protein